MINKIHIPSAIEASFLYAANWINNYLLEPLFLHPFFKVLAQKSKHHVLIELYKSYSKNSLTTVTEDFVEPI